MLPEEKARIKIDKQLNNAGWNIVSRQDYVPNYAMAIKEALMQGGNESDYLLFIDNKAIAVIEAKREENDLGDEVELQAENYAVTPENWYGTWFDNLIPLVYLANGKKILFKNLLTDPDGDYTEIKEMHSPKRMLQLINKTFLRDYCASINRRYDNNALFGHHLKMFITSFGFSPRDLALKINNAISQNILPPFVSPSDENRTRNNLISCLISNLEARKKLLELHRGYYAISPNDDTLIDKGFSKEEA